MQIASYSFVFVVCIFSRVRINSWSDVLASLPKLNWQESELLFLSYCCFIHWLHMVSTLGLIKCCLTCNLCFCSPICSKSWKTNVRISHLHMDFVRTVSKWSNTFWRSFELIFKRNTACFAVVRLYSEWGKIVTFVLGTAFWLEEK